MSSSQHGAPEPGSPQRRTAQRGTPDAGSPQRRASQRGTPDAGSPQRRAVQRRPRRSKPAKRSRPWWILWAAVPVLIVLGFWWLRSGVPEQYSPVPSTIDPLATEPLLTCHLYLPDAKGDLVRDTFYVRAPHDAESAARIVIDQLAKRGASAPVVAWPAHTTLLDLFVTPEGIAYVNFAGSLRHRLPAGDQAEWLVVASLTRSLCETFSVIRGVRLMVDGEIAGPLRRALALDRTYWPAYFAPSDQEGITD